MGQMILDLMCFVVLLLQFLFPHCLLSQVIVFERAGLVFCFNFHPSRSLPDYRVGVDVAGEYKIVLDTDWGELGGHGIKDRQATSHTVSSSKGWHGRRTEMMVYLPCRTAAVWKRVGDTKL